MTTIDLLRAAHSVIADPKNWTTDCLARDAAGDAIDPRSPKAVCWCIYGALIRAGVKTDNHPATRLVSSASQRLFGHPIVFVNDTKGHAASIQVLDAAIAAAEAEAR